LLPFLVSGNVKTSAKTIVALAGTNRWCRSFVNKPEHMLQILNSLPFVAHAEYIAKKMIKMPVMGTPQVKLWLSEKDEHCRENFHDLVKAVQSNSIEEIKRIIQSKNICLDCVLPLLLAAQKGHKKIVELLLSAGVNPKEPIRYQLGENDYYEVTCRERALQEGHIEIATILAVAEASF
jgi:hypothetical protein